MKKNSTTINASSIFANVALVAPTALIIVSLILLVVINLIFNPTFWMIADGEPVSPTPILITILNGALFIIAALGLLTLLPGIVYGLRSKLVH